MNPYISLYRKYRPKSFEEVVGQKITVDILKNSIKQNKIGHAYIFSGPRGTGKTSVAKIFSRAVNCLNNKDGDICGECPNCLRKIDDEIDIIEIDAASNNGVDEIREIRNNVRLLPSNLKYKIYIVDEVHMLSDSAFNALLKTLEEPPSHVIFILATTEINKIPSTVLSRCQKFNFKKLNNGEIYNRLKFICENEGKTKSILDDSLKLIATISDGGLRDAINLLDQALSVSDKVDNNIIYDLIGSVDENYLFDMLDNIINSNMKSLVDNISYIIDNGKNINVVINNLQNIVENIIIYNNCENYFDSDYESKLSKYSKIDTNLFIELSKQMFELLFNLRKSNNQRIMLEIYLFKMCFIFNNENSSIKENDISIDAEKKEETKKDKIIDEEVNSNIIERKQALINNCLSLAKKEYKINFLDNFNKVNDYITDKEYNSVSNLLLKATPEVVSNKIVLFTYDKEFDLILFNKNTELIEKFLKLLYNNDYEVVGVLSDEWINIKEEYIKNINSGKKYKYIDVSKKTLSRKKSKNLENKIEDIFGNIQITED